MNRWSRPWNVVGAGLAGAVLARELAERTDSPVLVLEERDHVAGLCHTERDPETGVLVHRCGSHIFHSEDERAWRFLSRFADMRPCQHRVGAVNRRGRFPLPINLTTINRFFGVDFDADQARAFIDSRADKHVTDPSNLEEQFLAQYGRELYEAFFYGYSKKHWGCEPRELPASVASRQRLRFDDDDRYFQDRFEGIPADGYTDSVRRMLDHEKIAVQTHCSARPGDLDRHRHLFWTGPLDAYFEHRHGRLSYRTVTWLEERASGDVQGTSVLNYTELDVPHTRIHEHKHLAPWEDHQGSVIHTEFSKATGPEDDPAYPRCLSADEDACSRYMAEAAKLTDVSFLGRLGTYRYLDMDQVIKESLEMADRTVTALARDLPLPLFPASLSRGNPH